MDGLELELELELLRAEGFEEEDLQFLAGRRRKTEAMRDAGFSQVDIAAFWSRQEARQKQAIELEREQERREYVVMKLVRLPRLEGAPGHWELESWIEGVENWLAVPANTGTSPEVLCSLLLGNMKGKPQELLKSVMDGVV